MGCPRAVRGLYDINIFLWGDAIPKPIYIVVLADYCIHVACNSAWVNIIISAPLIKLVY